MPLWFDAYWLDCSHLSDAEHGRYLLIMKALWTAPSQRIPNEDTWLARHFRRSEEAVRTEIRPLLEEFCSCDGNWWKQKRLSEEFKYVLRKREQQSARSKSRWNKEKHSSRGNAAPHASGNATHTHTNIPPLTDSESISESESYESPPLNVGDVAETPAGTNGHAKAKPKAARRKPAVPLPPEWRPDLDYARGLGMSDREINWQANSMIDRARMKDERFVDWDARWRNWCRTYVNSRDERRTH